MAAYIARRLLYMLIILMLLSVVSFIVIQLPPGDYVSSLVLALESQGEPVTDAEVAALRQQYGLDVPPVLRYFRWFGRLLRGDMGMSFTFSRPVRELIAERLPLTMMISGFTIVFTYALAVPIGIYSATHQYSFGDYAATFVGFIGLALPNFLLALVLMFIFLKFFSVSVGGLFSQEYFLAPWSFGKFLDMLKHLPIPVIVIGTAGTAGIIRVMRGSLLDELSRQYVITARAKGLAESRLLFKYPVRVAINPIVSTVGWLLPAIVSGETITAIVLSLPTTGPLLFNALMSQDTYLAGSTVMFLTVLTVAGTLISDLLLVLVDPRIRLG